MPECLSCGEYKRKEKLEKIPIMKGYLCRPCKDQASEKLEIDDISDLDESSFSKALEFTKEKRQE